MEPCPICGAVLVEIHTPGPRFVFYLWLASYTRLDAIFFFLVSRKSHCPWQDCSYSASQRCNLKIHNERRQYVFFLPHLFIKLMYLSSFFSFFWYRQECDFIKLQTCHGDDPSMLEQLYLSCNLLGKLHHTPSTFLSTDSESEASSIAFYLHFYLHYQVHWHPLDPGGAGANCDIQFSPAPPTGSFLYG